MNSSPFYKTLGIVCSVFDAYTAVLFLSVQTGASTTILKYQGGFSLGDKIIKDAIIQDGQGLIGWINRNRQPLLVPNFDQRKHVLGYYSDNEEAGIKAFMGCPLPSGRGVICVDSKRQYSFAEKDQKMLHLFAEMFEDQAEHISRHILQADLLRYYSALKMIYVLRRESTKWHEFLDSFLNTVSKATGYEYCLLCTQNMDGANYSIEGENYALIDKPGRPKKEFPINSGMVGWVFKNASPLFSGGKEGVEDAPLLGRSGDIPVFRSVMSVPILVQKRVVGVLCYASEQMRDLGPEVQEFAKVSSEHLALFLENLSLRSKLREMHRELPKD